MNGCGTAFAVARRVVEREVKWQRIGDCRIVEVGLEVDVSDLQ